MSFIIATSIYFTNTFTHSNIQTISISGAKIQVLFQLSVISLTVRVGHRWGRGCHSWGR